MTKRAAEQESIAVNQFIRDRAFQVDALLNILGAEKDRYEGGKCWPKSHACATRRV